ncbi:hypothetical protein [Streptacidiphilus sp. EB129]|uniref:hypothetical protein n=1 Tax=Streptacidiphilus sp. EB129 TaxID=3156262 RepID=UPI0035121A96
MSITTAFRIPTVGTKGAGIERTGFAPEQGPDLSGIKPLSPWFFVFEGLMSGAYDITRLNPNAWMVLSGLGLVNMLVGLTVLGKRRKLVRTMLKNSRTRSILVALIGLRVGVHVLLGLLGAQVTTTAGHLVLAVLMTGATVGLMWFDQRVTFRALGLSLAR